MTTTPARDNQAQADDCEHYFASHIRGGEPLHVRLCQLCHEPDWADLAEQAAEVRAATLAEYAEVAENLAENFRLRGDGDMEAGAREVAALLRENAEAAARPDNTRGA